MQHVATDVASGKLGQHAARGLAGDEASTPLLQIKDLQTYFFTREGIVKAVDGANLEVQPGKTLGIVGESGCGKSITAKSILQIVDKPGRVVGGQILYNRREGTGQARTIDLVALPPDSAEMRSIRGGEISMIFQEPMTSFSPVHTVGNQLVEAIRLHRNVDKREATEIASEWLRRVGIPNPAQRMGEFPYRLSGGQCQRAMIAMALATDPKMLIADEPTTALDVTTQAQILNLLQSLQREQGMAMIFITHALGVIAEMADEVAVMYLGRVVERAPVKELFTNPKHPYTQALMTSIPSIDALPRERLPSVKGSIPHPQNKPTGCPFHPRCPAFMPGVCDQKEPQLAVVGANHQASCFLYPGA
ncbi:MAG: ABC transporter ATP-binding protein [Caldilineaceae bacterium]|nr:ABC transporter ATP-binding protein [Caldilineaceae bacterium]